MKYSLYKDLLDQNNILSHVFFNCLTKENIEKIASENKELPEEDIKAREIEVELTINGISVNPKAFFDLFNDQHTEAVKKQATELVKEQMSEKFFEIRDKLMEYESIIDSWAEEINWQADNLLIKKEETEKK